MRSIRNVNVCVVGGAGFLGSHLVNTLIEDRNCWVLVIDNLEAGRREFVHPKAEFVHNDITGSEEFLLQLFKKHSIKFVLNFAARPYVPDSFDRPIRTCDVNFMGSLKVINAAQEAGCEGILQVSSAEIYGHSVKVKNGGASVVYEGEQRNITEMDLVAPHSSYGAAKAAIDALVQVRWREAKTPCIALRQFNCVGERETHPYIVPELISQLAAFRCEGCKGTGQIFHVLHEGAVGGFDEYECRHCGGAGHRFGPGGVATVRLGNNSFRDFLYAGDAVRIAVELLERGEFGEVYNLGSETGIKMYDLAKLIGNLMGFADVKVEEDEARVRPWEIWMLCSSNEKIYQVVESRPSVTLENALKKTIEWYNQNGRKWCWE